MSLKKRKGKYITYTSFHYAILDNFFTFLSCLIVMFLYLYYNYNIYGSYVDTLNKSRHILFLA